MLSILFPAEFPAWVWPLAASSVVLAAAAIPVFRSRIGRTVFLSYRRSDSAAETAALGASLRKRFGNSRVFHDISSIRAGEDFRLAIRRRLRKVDATIVMIGPEWARCTSKSGALRLHEKDDLVRAEVAAAIASGALVIPLLIRGASMPERDELPEDLQALRDLNAAEFAKEDAFIDDIARAPVRRTPALLLVGHLAVFLLLFTFYRAGGLVPDELLVCMGIASPMFSATCAVALANHWRPANPARIQQVSLPTLLLPYGFVAIIAALIVLKATNVGWVASPLAFEIAFAVAETAFGAHTGVALAQLLENRTE